MLKRALGLAIGAALTLTLFGALASGASAKTVWLCFPGHKPNPCTPGLSTTVYSPKGNKVAVQHPKAVARPTVDCFYVYPTVSGQTTGNANLQIDPEEASIALYQAARYSQYCKVYAPMYRQVTLAGIGTTGTKPPNPPPNQKLGPQDVQNAFQTYLKKYNHGRGIVFIGHSQGSFVLRQLLAKDVDPKPAVRRLLVSAILMGGNVLVKKGKDIGGDFKHIPACHSATQIGCVIAFSTFDKPVPTPSLFGRPSPVLGSKVPKGVQVLCTNPAALGGGSALLDTIQPSAPFDPKSILNTGIALLGLTPPHPPTVWVAEPGSYRGRCSSANNANVLMISAVGGAKLPTPSPTPDWGLHLLDAQVALGNEVSDVKSEAAAFLRSGR
ncbi:MAG TPA: DUF3089 domain-containing protein [Solirubrobacteraceae bacterium]|jgi:hypothetical protein